MPEAPRHAQNSAKTSQPVKVGGTIPQRADMTPIHKSPTKDVLIFRLILSTLENNSDESSIPTANASSTKLPYMADKPK